MTPQEYLSETCHSLKNPRLEENPVIYQKFQTLANYILGGDFDESILVFDCYTTAVYPRYIQLSGCNFIAWDNHLWDIYGGFLYIFLMYTNIGKSINRDFFINYYDSLLLIFLANRFEKEPAFSRYLAEEYSKMTTKFPPYNDYEDINDILSKVGHQQEFDISRMFGFCHEVSHIAFRKKKPLVQAVQKEVLLYCETVTMIINTSREVDALLGITRDETQNERMLDITKKLLVNSDKKLLEEICCDITAFIVLSKYFETKCDMTSEQIGLNLSTLHCFLVFMSWLSSSEEFWKGIKEAYTIAGDRKTPALLDDSFYRMVNKITDEHAVRSNFVFSFCKDKMDMKIDDSLIRKELYGSGFTEILEKARGNNAMYSVLSKTQNAKTDYAHAIAHQKKKNELIGWENE